MRIHKVVLLSGAVFALGAGAALSAPAAKPPARPTATASIPPRHVGPLTLIMRGLDKITGRATTLLIPIGKSAQYATLTITARYCYSTAPTEKPEHRVFSGWMYASSPGLNGLEHPLYDAWVITCRAVAPGETVVIGPSKPVRPVSPDAADTEKPAALPEGSGQ
jgi:hypothetical protein